MAYDLDQRYGWLLNLGKVEYQRVLAWQHGLVKMRRDGMARDTIVLVEHPPVVTVGRDGHAENYEKSDCDPVFVERGGDVTYHGPGQLVAYFVFNLSRRGKDLHRFMQQLQEGIIETMREFKIDARTGDEHTGVWVGDSKIASIGIAVKNWITYHGVAINLNTDLTQFKAINPCGLQAEVMTTAAAQIGKPVALDVFGGILIDKYADIFETIFQPIELDMLAEDLESQAGGYTI